MITFYHYYKTTPPARCTVQVCRAEACQSMGGDALLEVTFEGVGLKRLMLRAAGQFMTKVEG